MDLQKDIATHLGVIVGLSESNVFAENACFEAHHLLNICKITFAKDLSMNR